MPRNKQAALRYRLLESMLRNNMRRYTAEDLIGELINKMDLKSLSKSTFDKDIAEMRRQGAPIVVNKDNQYYYENREFSLQELPLDESDRNLLNFSLMVLGAYKESSIYKKFDTTIDRIFTGSRLEKLYDKKNMNLIQVEQAPVDTGQRWLETVFNAIVNEEVLSVNYERFGKPQTTRSISPYLLKEYRNRWYVVGYAEETGYVNVFALDRIKDISASDKAFFQESGFHPDDYFKYSYGVHQYHESQPEKIILEFYPPHIDYIRTQPLHPSQETLEERESVLKIQLFVYISPEVEMMVRGYGSGVKVLHPGSLIESIRQEAVTVSTYYP